MAYSLRRGVQNENMDNTQKGLLVGLPAIALALSFGAAHHGTKSPAAAQAQTIPVVASLKHSGGGGSNSSNTSGSGSKNPGGAATGAYSGPGYTTALGPAGGSSGGLIGSGGGSSGTSGGTGGIVGGMGGGPTGATSGSGGTTTGSGGGTTGGTGGGGTTGGTGGGGGSTGGALPSCSLGQIATVNCLVTACSPPITLAPGQKAILGLDGTCVVLN